jgi:RHS repeat-associated protein
MTTGPDGSGAWVLWDKLDVAEQHEFHPGAADRVTIFTRDANRKVTDVEQPSGKHVGYVQGNCCGSIDTLVDSAGNQTHWQYDVLGRVAAKWLRWGQPGEVQVQTLGYDAVGRPTAIQDARGNAKTFGYDAEGRLSAIQYAVNAANTRPTSDVALSYEPVYGRLATVSDGTGVTSYGYVPFNAADGVFGDGALATESKSVGAGVQFTHSYSYDALGRTLTGPRQTSAQWDALGRLTGAASGLGAFTFGYQGNSGRLATVDAALTDATVAFNTGFTYQGAAQGRRLTDIVHQVGFAPADWRVLSQHNYGYDALGRLSTWQKSWRDWATAMQTGTWALTHDTDDQLTGIAETDAAATPTGSFAYGYDLAGNRTTADRTTPAGGTVNRQWTPNGLNQLTAQSAGPEAGAYTHDLDGNLLADNTRTYQWDAENRLVGVTGPFGTVTWEYDAFSRRVKQHDTAPAGPEIVRDLIWEGLSIIESRNQATGEIRRYYGNGEERELAAAVTRLFYTTDHLGSIRELTDATGTIRARYDYDPYGNVSKLSGNLDTDFAYTGHYYHAASGLHLAPYRGYNPKFGRWLSRDPIGEEGGINLYGYVGNRPTMLIDPLGLIDVDVVIWRAKLSSGSVGHVMVISSNSDEVHLSQYPHKPGERTLAHGPNTTFTCPQTMTAQGRQPTHIFRIHLPNDAGFLLAAKTFRGLPYWDAFPNRKKGETHCEDAAADALMAGGFPKFYGGAGLPGALADTISRYANHPKFGPMLRKMDVSITEVQRTLPK